MGAIGINWDAVGAWGQWAGAVGTTAAFFAAVKLLKVERKRDAEHESALIMAQAQQVAAWPSEVRSDFSDPVSPSAWGVAIANRSELPVYQAHFQLRHIDDLDGYDFDVVPPGDWRLSGSHLYRRSEQSETRASARNLPPLNFTVSLEFTDAAGRRWRRSDDGLVQPNSA